MALEIRGLTKSFWGSHKTEVLALHKVSLTVGDGEVVSLIGPSGCGKSSLLDIVSGLSLPDYGDVELDGRSIVGKKGYVGYMPQKDVLFPWRTILDNVIVPLEIQGISKRVARQEALALLPTFGLENFAHSYPYTLSGGMRQRASFLRTYLCKKGFLLLDEPFGKLDALTRLQMQQWLMRMWQSFQQSVLFVTHDVDEAILLSDRIYVLSPRPGQLVAEVEVPIARPRSTALSTSNAFMQVKTELLKVLEQGMSSN